MYHGHFRHHDWVQPMLLKKLIIVQKIIVSKKKSIIVSKKLLFQKYYCFKNIKHCSKNYLQHLVHHVVVHVLQMGPGGRRFFLGRTGQDIVLFFLQSCHPVPMVLAKQMFENNAGKVERIGIRVLLDFKWSYTFGHKIRHNTTQYDTI